MISLSHLTFRYDNKPVFRDVSFDLPCNTLCIGKNGAGKTTLLRLIAAILTPECGKIELDGRTDFNAVCMDNSRMLMQDFTLNAHVQWIASAFHVSRGDCQKQMQRFSLSAWRPRKPAELSDGEKQWMALALSTLMPADIYLLDEPMRSLDREMCAEFSAILDEMIDEGKRFVLSAHHDRDIRANLTVCSIHDIVTGGKS